MAALVQQYSKHVEDRGEIYTTYNKYDFPKIKFVQDKVSVSKKGVIRGFHGDKKTYKLITCLYGDIKLVVFNPINLRSERFYLSSKSDSISSILVPPNHFNAHQCLSDECIFHYKWSEYYSLEDQYSIYYNDETIDPQWEKIEPKIISERDLKAPRFLEIVCSL